MSWNLAKSHQSVPLETKHHRRNYQCPNDNGSVCKDGATMMNFFFIMDLPSYSGMIEPSPQTIFGVVPSAEH